MFWVQGFKACGLDGRRTKGCFMFRLGVSALSFSLGLMTFETV